MNRINSFVEIAAAAGISPADAIAVPAAVGVFAKHSGMSEAAMIAELMRNKPLRAYLAEVCAKAAKAA